jgi:hypothetical protein
MPDSAEESQKSHPTQIRPDDLGIQLDMRPFLLSHSLVFATYAALEQRRDASTFQTGSKNKSSESADSLGRTRVRLYSTRRPNSIGEP